MLAIITHPIMYAAVYPVLILGLIVLIFELSRPDQDDTTWQYSEYKQPEGRIYYSEHAEKTRVKPYWLQYHTKDPGTPLHDELERRMVARLIAHNILYELGQAARKNTHLALSV